MTWSRDPLGVTSPTPLFIPDKIEREAVNTMRSPLLSYTQEVIPDAGDPIFESTLPHYDPTADRFHIEDQLSNAIPDQNCDFSDGEPSRLSDPGGTYWPYPVAMGSRLLLDNTDAAPIAGEANAWGHTNPSVSRPLDRVGNKETTQPFAGPPLDETQNVGSQHTNKGKRVAIDNERRTPLLLTPYVRVFFCLVTHDSSCARITGT